MLPALAKNLDLLSRNWFDGVQFHIEAFRRSDRIDPVKPKNNRQQSVFCPRRAYFLGSYPEHLNTHNWSGTSFTVTVATCAISKKQGARGCQDEVAAHVRQKHIQANISFVLKWISVKICAALEWTSFKFRPWQLKEEEYFMLWLSWRSLKEGTVGWSTCAISDNLKCIIYKQNLHHKDTL